jgi:hypothetical protein
MTTLRAGLLVAATLIVATGCPSTSAPPRPKPAAVAAYAQAHGYPGAVRVELALPRGAPQPFFALPWPSELRRAADGSVDLSGFPGSDHFAISGFFAAAAKNVLGFSVSPVIYLRFSAAVDPALIDQALDTGAIRLVALDAPSERIPLRRRYYAEPTRYVPEHTLALRPTQGRVLRPDAVHALVVARELADGAPLLGTTDDFEHLKHTAPRADPVEERARQVHAAAFDALEKNGLARGDIGALALFRTQRAHEPVLSLLKAADRLPAADRPRLLEATWWPDDGVAPYRVIQGYYCTPNFQSGLEHAPFIQRGGVILDGPDGAPRVAHLERRHEDFTPSCGGLMQARFVLSVPRGEMPANGWPLLIYAHGTTGWAGSVLGQDSFAARAAAAGMAAVSTDQPLHGGDDPRGGRPGSRKPLAFKLGPVPIPLPNKGKGGELGFFNILRPMVMRDNLRQATVDAALLARLMMSADLTRVLSSDGGSPVPRIDAGPGYVATGHSQGSDSIALLGAVDPLVRGVVLSACGGDWGASALERPDAAPVERILALVMGLSPGELDEFHPLLAAVQTMIDPVDPQTFGPLYQQATPPRSVLHVSGVGDSMTVTRASRALASSMGAAAVAPFPKAELGLPELVEAEVVAGNGSGGAATFAWVAFKPAGYDGHFVTFYEPAAWRVIEAFLRSLASGTVPPPVRVEAP